MLDLTSLSSALKNLSASLEHADSPTEILRLTQIAQEHIFKAPHYQKELQLSEKLNIELIKKITNVSAQAYFNSVKVQKELLDDLKNQREQIFWGLKDYWWKQIIDKPCHAFGPEVFDKALHGGPLEPGFLGGIAEASQVATKFIGTENSVAIYKEIHRAACHHFEKKENDPHSVLISGSETGQFKRLQGIRVRFDLTKVDTDLGYLLTFKKLHLYPDLYVAKLNKIELSYPGISNDLSIEEMIQKNESLLKTKLEVWQTRINTVASEMYSISKEIGIEAPLIIWAGGDGITIAYRQMKQEELEIAVEFLFERFNKKAKQCQEELKSNLDHATFEILPTVQALYETAIRQNIAELFQYLEWLHPFPDGQGRTDLILLAKLLTDYGLHPAILERPYDSSTLPFAELDAKLVIGLENWEKETGISK